MPKPNNEEEQVRRLVRAALDIPSRPLRMDEIERLVQQAAERRKPAVSWKALLALSLGPLLVTGIAWASGFSWPGLLNLALVIPAANLALGPVAAYLLIHRSRASQDQH